MKDNQVICIPYKLNVVQHWDLKSEQMKKVSLHVFWLNF